MAIFINIVIAINIMKLIKEVMVKSVVTVKPDDSVSKVVRLFRKKDIRGAPVVENGKVAGIISEKDIARLMEECRVQPEVLMPKPFDLGAPFRIKKAAGTKVKSIMTKGVVSISPEAHIQEAAAIMVSKKINRLPVINEKSELVGIITRADVLKALCG